MSNDLRIVESMEEFLANNSGNRQISEMLVYSFDASTGKINISVNEGFAADLQLFVREILDLLVDKGVKGRQLDKKVEANLLDITNGFKAGKSAEDVVAAIA